MEVIQIRSRLRSRDGTGFNPRFPALRPDNRAVGSSWNNRCWIEGGSSSRASKKGAVLNQDLRHCFLKLRSICLQSASMCHFVFDALKRFQRLELALVTSELNETQSRLLQESRRADTLSSTVMELERHLQGGHAMSEHFKAEMTTAVRALEEETATMTAREGGIAAALEEERMQREALEKTAEQMRQRSVRGPINVGFSMTSHGVKTRVWIGTLDILDDLLQHGPHITVTNHASDPVAGGLRRQGQRNPGDKSERGTRQAGVTARVAEIGTGPAAGRRAF
eukprot:1033764-Rhodomonas_salina.3